MRKKTLALNRETVRALGARGLAAAGGMLRSNISCNAFCSAGTNCPSFCGTCAQSCWSACTCIVGTGCCKSP